MPLARLSRLTLYYETYGDENERTLLLINGLGSDHREWLYQIPAFKRKFRVIAFDNRGTGLSDAPPPPYTTAEMADDAAALLDHLGIARASVLGVSMGGLIAQMVAIRHPQAVEKLVLGCTAVGGDRSIKPPPEVMAAFSSFDPDDREGSVRRVLPYLYTEDFIRSCPEEIERFVRFSSTKKQSPEGYAGQLAAISTHSSWDLLSSIEAETLVITGTADRVIPPENSRLLAERIPHARLHLIEGAPHRLFAENHEEFNRVVLEFLLS